MKVTVLGSCTVIDFPHEIERFFDGDHLVDPRNGLLMEMDAWSLWCLARDSNDHMLQRRICRGLLANLSGSSPNFWSNGMWGFDEAHLRFTSTALRLIVFELGYFSINLTKELLARHASFHDKIGNGLWFLHDSIEYNQQSFYPKWTGIHFSNSSPHNMLILNTHLDTLTTLLVANHMGVRNIPGQGDTEALIRKGLDCADDYFDKSEVANKALSALDSIIRAVIIKHYSGSSLISRFIRSALYRVYYKKIRLSFKKYKLIKQWRDGFWERDLRLQGPSLEYHVVNIWDAARLLLWMKINHIQHPRLESSLRETTSKAIKFCANSGSYENHMRLISKDRGISNELLEALVILSALGYYETNFNALYIKWREMAPPSPGIMGIDPIISGTPSQQIAKPALAPDYIDWIPVPYLNTVVIVNNDNVSPYLVTESIDQKTSHSVAPLSLYVLRAAKETLAFS